jgi:MYXO-CTERM domain-containing protein
MVFPTLKNAAGVNSMQISEVQFYALPEPSTLAMGLLGVAAAGCIRRKR